jgi:hypothetical protein
MKTIPRGSVIFWDGVDQSVIDSQIVSNSDAKVAGAVRIGGNTNSLYQGDPSIVGYTGLDYDPNPWNSFWVDHIRLPGVCRVKGLTKCNVKNRKAPGSKGNKPTVLGYAPSEFDVICTVWTPNHLSITEYAIGQLWHRPMINPRVLAGTTKIDPAQFTHAVYHPKLDLMSIRYCVINQVGLLEDGKEPGTMTWAIKFTENRDPGKKDQTATPKAAPVKRDPSFNGPQPKNGGQLLPPSQDRANMSLVPPLFTPSGGPF